MDKKEVSLYYKKGVKRAGRDSRTLVSVLTGATSQKDATQQLKKIEAIAALELNDQPDIISDLSLEHSKTALYKEIIKNFPAYIVSTLPIYKCNASRGKIDDQELLSIIQEQIESGVSFITIHPTVNQYVMQLAQNRLVPWTSRGGVMVMKDVAARNFSVENIYLRTLDEIIKLAFRSKVAISIGASFRSSNIFDSLDDCQLLEFKLQKQIADYIKKRGVDVIIEGPGHSSTRRLRQVAEIYDKMGYPIMPLGPIPTDTSIGQDHISSAIGATVLGLLGCVDIISAVTREEHTGKIPSIESTIEAIKASKVAAHIIDMDKLQDYSIDKKIVDYRTSHQTCIYEKQNSGCSRCAHVCPLEYKM
ncbi:thiamine biosynthesis protein ThiC [Mucilaginibacter hurinus]|uniref:Thiamine biosynthesis protein ThiC n=1 Tax=Mucilaginibacter hurinus TaxID=2201324 RepID=A0A367GS70_9SPHI|nr:phosphomethylpyrimidine synthase ThiC [Mucilaginibacter hurinus]RCH56287.1 thiamine biosynthesis protein ThiC [Mucilaginibacter hurinus]